VVTEAYRNAAHIVRSAAFHAPVNQNLLNHRVLTQEPALQIAQLVCDVSNEASYRRFATMFAGRAVRTWSTPNEKALFYGLANRHTPGGVVVELGSYCGGSAAFFARGLADKPGGGAGRVVCVDPLLGAPPWLALPPQMFTLAELRANIVALGIESYIDLKIGDSAAVGATWPAELIDVLLIDGDHSFEGALRDLECWAPKLRDGGILLFDDIDNIAEMRAVDEIMGSMRTLVRHGVVDGIGVHEVQQSGWRLLDELQTLVAAKHLHRPWSFEPVHALALSQPYQRTHEWTEPAVDLAYDLGYLAVAEKGDYAVLTDTPTELVQVVRSIHTDRGGGDLHVAGDALRYGRTFRLVACRPEQAARMYRLLLPGGVLLAWSDVPITPEEAARLADTIRSAGFDGVGHGGEDRPLFWGVANIAALAPGQIMQAHMAVRAPRCSDAQ
jgi:predicted O-methyltransferase YrrM